jgi:hypothetical protein
MPYPIQARIPSVSSGPTTPMTMKIGSRAISPGQSGMTIVDSQVRKSLHILEIWSLIVTAAF